MGGAVFPDQLELIGCRLDEDDGGELLFRQRVGGRVAQRLDELGVWHAQPRQRDLNVVGALGLDQGHRRLRSSSARCARRHHAVGGEAVAFRVDQ